MRKRLRRTEPPVRPRVVPTHFGLTAVITAGFSALFLAGYFAITVLRITPHTFFAWNNILAGLYCLTTPAAVVLAIVALSSVDDSRRLAWIAIAVAGLPFAVLFWQFTVSIISSNSS